MYLLGKAYDNNMAALDVIKKNLKAKAPIYHPISVPLQLQQQPIVSGVSTTTILLNNISGPISSIWFVIRKTSDLTTQGQYVYNNYQAVSSFAIRKADGSYINNSTVYPGTFIQSVYLPELIKGSSGFFIYFN